MKREGVFENLLLAEEIARAAYVGGVSAIPAIGDDTCIFEQDGMYYMIFNWTDAKKIAEEDITAGHCKKIGGVLAKIHSIDYISPAREMRTEFPKISVSWDKYLGYDSESAQVIHSNIKKLYKWKDLINEAAPKIYDDVINHNDMDIKNVLWDKDMNPVIIDWEAAGYSNSLTALLQVAADWSHAYDENFDVDFFGAVINGYIDEGGFMDGDIEAVINYSFKGMMEWLEYSVKRSLGVEVNDEAERTLGEEQTYSTMKALLNYEKNLEKIKECFDQGFT
jgi:Ser/Thr protein kinase RdoA (MazF antagonist)